MRKFHPGRGCASKEGWIPAGDHINSGQGHSEDIYLLLNLRVSGFRGREEVIKGRSVTVGQISLCSSWTVIAIVI